MKASAMMGLLLLTGASALHAQEGKRPAGWLVRPDRADAADSLVSFVTMSPGWHVTTPLAALLADPVQRGTGRFRIECETYLFPGAANDAYGVFAFGRGVEGAAPGYAAFVLRKDGAFAVLRREDGVTTALVPWTVHPIVAAPQPGLPARNEFVVEAEGESVRFRVNGADVAVVSRVVLGAGDRVGVRVGEGTDAHVTRFEVGRVLGDTSATSR